MAPLYMSIMHGKRIKKTVPTVHVRARVGKYSPFRNAGFPDAFFKILPM
jgi:hypothetical protein